MAERAAALNTGIFGLETTLGVQVPSTKRLLCTEFSPNPLVPTTPYRPTGFLAPTTSVQGKQATSAAIGGKMCYTDLVYLFSSYLKTAAFTTPSGATNTRRATFKPSATTVDTFASYTLEKGYSAGAERLTGAVVNDMTMRWTDVDASLTGNIMGQVLQEQITLTGGPTDIPALPIDPKSISVYIGSTFNTNQVQTVTLSVAGGAATGGSFTLSFEPSYVGDPLRTTAPIAWNASAATVQAALQALPNLGANVTVGGGPAPSAAFTLTFSGLFAGVDATLVTGNAALLTGPGAPYANPTVVDTTPGGMAKLSRLLSAEVVLPARYQFPYTLNDADPSWSFIVPQGVEPRCNIVVEHDATGSGFMTQFRARTTYYAKILARGSVAETVSSVPFPYSLQLSFPFKFVENQRADTNGVYGSTYGMALHYDTAFGGFIQADCDTLIAAL